MKRVLWIGLCLWLAAGSLSADTVYMTNGDVYRNVKVLDDGAKTVRFRIGRKFQKVPAEEVASIEFSGTPRRFQEGLRFFKKYLFRKAIESFQKVKIAKFVPYAQFYIAESHRMLGEFREAINAYQKLAKRNFRLTPRALYQMGLVHLQRGSAGRARQTFKDLIDGNYSTYWNLMGRYGLGMAQFRRKNFGPAEDEFLRVIEKAKRLKGEKFVLLRHLALQGRGLVMVERKLYEKAKKLFEQVLKESSNEEVLAGCYIGLGRMYYRKAKDGKDKKNNYKRALLSFLRVSTLYPKFKLLYAEALHLAAECYEAIGQRKFAKKLRNEIEVRVPKWARYKGF